MKRTVILLALTAAAIVVITAGAAALLGAHTLGRQFRRVSPHEHVSDVVDGAKLTITYGRPSMRGRRIFGSLVPYGHVWCPGADEATTLDSSKDLEIGGLRISSGTHTIWMLPGPDRWTLVVSTEEEGFHNRYHEDRDLGRAPLARRSLESPVEQLTFAIAKTASGGEITMSWETTAVTAAFTVVR